MPLQDKTILVIDDDEDILHQIKNAIQGTGASCILAQNIQDGLDLSLKKVPHLIITDLSLPEESGFDFLEKKRKISEIKNIPVLVFSKMSQMDSFKKAIQLGATDYLIKPMKTAVLIQKVRRCILKKSSLSTVQYPVALSVQVDIQAQIFSLHSQYFKILSSCRLQAGHKCKLNSSLLDELGIKQQSFTIRKDSTLFDEGTYCTEISFAGLDEEVQELIMKKMESFE